MIITLLFILVPCYVHSWDYNPYCWLKNCKNMESSDTSSIFDTLNPYCYFRECSQSNGGSSGFLRLNCWFTDCSEPKSKPSGISFQNFYYNYQDSWVFKYNPFSWLVRSMHHDKSWYCWFGICSGSDADVENAENEYSYSHSISEYLSSYIKSMLPPKSSLSNSFVDQYSRHLSTFESLRSVVMEMVPQKKTLSIALDNLNPYCWFDECCNALYIPGNFEGLRKALKYRLFGQPFVEDIAIAIESHWKNKKSNKALVLSIHGVESTGKTLTSKLIAENLFQSGEKSAFVHSFVGGVHFQDLDHLGLLKNNLYHWIKGNISNCPNQLFIFDHANLLPQDLLSDIVPILNRNNIEGVDLTRSIFIFSSRSGGFAIKEKTLEMRQNNVLRTHMRLPQFEKNVFDKIYNDGKDITIFQNLKELNVIDHYIPFLPLEEEHVTALVKEEFKQRGVAVPLEKHVSEIMETIEWEEHNKNIKFLKTDLRSITTKISFYAAKYYYDDKMDDEL